jgi:hypothetical protein
MSKSITTVQLRKLAGEAYAFGCAQGPNGYDRGYASGVEDLARLLSERDPAISERLVEILAASGLRDKLPALYR